MDDIKKRYFRILHACENGSLGEIERTQVEEEGSFDQGGVGGKLVFVQKLLA